MSILELRYQLSDVRSEPVPEASPPRSQPLVVDDHIELYQFSPLDDCGPPQRVLSQGEMADGSVTVNHPAVEAYIKRTKASLDVSKARHWASPMGWPWHTTDGRSVAWWSAEKAGLVRMGDSWAVCHTHVEGMLGVGKLQRPTIQAVFALAALSLIARPHELLFWAFWGLHSSERTAELVDEVVGTYPPLITIPESVVWTDKASALAAIEESRRPLLPKSMPPIQFISANLRLFTEEPKAARSAKRKRAAEDSDAGQPVAKRTRKKPARCTEAKPQAPLNPPRKSTRLRKATDAAVAIQGAEAGTGDVEITIDTEVVVDVEMVEETQGQVETVALSKKTRRAATKTTSRRKATSAKKRSAPRKSAAAAAPNSAVEQAPQEVALLPAPPSPGHIRIPARAPSTVPVFAPSLPLLDNLVVPSAEATAVGTPAPLEGVTCVNTPDIAAKEQPLELEKVDAKLAAPAKASGRTSAKAAARTPATAPVRASARIRQKTGTAN